jgi:hypothetical protein
VAASLHLFLSSFVAKSLASRNDLVSLSFFLDCVSSCQPRLIHVILELFFFFSLNAKAVYLP